MYVYIYVTRMYINKYRPFSSFLFLSDPFHSSVYLTLAGITPVVVGFHWTSTVAAAGISFFDKNKLLGNAGVVSGGEEKKVVVPVCYSSDGLETLLGDKSKATSERLTGVCKKYQKYHHKRVCLTKRQLFFISLHLFLSLSGYSCATQNSNLMYLLLF